MLVPLLLLAMLLEGTCISDIRSTVEEKWSDTMTSPYKDRSQRCVAYLQKNLGDFLQQMERPSTKVSQFFKVLKREI